MLDFELTICPPEKEIKEITDIFRDRLGVHFLVLKNKIPPPPTSYHDIITYDIVISSSENKHDILMDMNFTPLEWLGEFTCNSQDKNLPANNDRLTNGKLFVKAIYGTVSWLSRGNVLYKPSGELENVEMNSGRMTLTFSKPIERYAVIPSFQNLSELKMKLDIRGAP
jgi:hypothetical protein